MMDLSMHAIPTEIERAVNEHQCKLSRKTRSTMSLEEAVHSTNDQIMQPSWAITMTKHFENTTRAAHMVPQRLRDQVLSDKILES